MAGVEKNLANLTIGDVEDDVLHGVFTVVLGRICVLFVRSYDCSFRQAQTSAQQPGQLVSPDWSPPQTDWVKINVDACCSPETNTAHSGIIIRNEVSQVMGACVMVQTSFTSVFMAEAQAALHGLQFALNLGFRRVILESDSRTLIQKLHSSEDDYSDLRSIIWDIRTLAQRFQLCWFNFTRHTNNRVAHALANSGRRFNQNRMWVEEAPPKIMVLVDEDKENSRPL